MRANIAKLVLISFLATILGPFTALAQSFDAKINSIEAITTIAGFDALVKTDTNKANHSIDYYITTPEDKLFKFSAQTDQDGQSKVKIYAENTEVAGEYNIKAQIEDDSKETILKVYPDGVSTQKSKLELNKNISKTGPEQKVIAKVDLRDKYNNKIENRKITLKSSRDTDTITKFQNSNDQFLISSNFEGTSTITVFDETTDKSLAIESPIIFTNSNNNFDQLAIGGPTSFLDISTTDTAEINELIDLSIVAFDSDNNVANDYDGTIRISILGLDSSDNADVPSDYTFTEIDLGVHEFEDAIRIQETGDFIIEVKDTEDPTIFGTAEITITNSDDSNTGSGEISIITPTEGSSFSTAVQTITGTTDPGKSVEIIIDQTKLSSVSSNEAGIFTFTTSPLTEGEHTIKANLLNDERDIVATSDEITITIDTSGPQIEDLNINPETDIVTNSVIEIELFSEENLSQVSIIFADQFFELDQDSNSNGKYIGSVQTPSNPGTYGIDIVLVDQFGNESAINDFTTVEVTEGDNNTSVTPPSRVNGLEALAEDSKVTLTWEPATDDTFVDHYRIYFGLSESNLVNSVDTFDATPTWYIPNLDNETTYFFAITAIDSEQNESELRSITVSSTPSANNNPTQPDPLPAPPKQPDTGIGALVFTLLAAMCGSWIALAVRKEKYS